MEKKKILKNGLVLATTLAATMTVFPRNITRAAVDEELGIAYSAHVQELGWMDAVNAGNSELNAIIAGTTGRALRTEAFTIKFKGPKDVNVKYNVHSAEKGWTGWKTSGEIAGTTGEGLKAEAIKISVDGLDQYGYEIRYRAHVEEKGWMSWVIADNSEDLTINYAGTTGQSLRIEAIQIVLVDVADGKLKELKEEAISNLNKYLAAIKLEKKADSDSKYNTYSKKIEDAIEEIEKAEKAKDVTETYNKTVADIEKAYKNINDDLKEVEKQASLARETAMEEIDFYKETLETANLSDSNKKMISDIIAKAENKVNTVQTADEIESTVAEMKTVLGNNEEYAKSIEKAEVTNDLLKAKKDAIDVLNAYEDALADVKLSNTNKAIIRNLIGEAKSKINNVKATNDEELVAAIEEIEATKDSVEAYMENYYEDVVKAKDEALLKNTMDAAIKALSEYESCGYENVEKAATNYIKETKKLTTVDEIKDAVYDEETGSLKDLKDMKTAAIKAEEDSQKAYDDTYKAAMKDLDKYQDIVYNSTDLTGKEVKELNELIENTRAIVEESTKTEEITEAINVFKASVGTYHADVAEQASEYELVKAKETAKAKLNTYADSEVTGVPAKVKTAIDDVEKAKTADNVNKKLDEAVLSIEKDIAVAELEEKYKDVDEEITDIDTYITAIEAATCVEDTYDEETDTDVKGVKTLLQEAIKAIDEAIAQNEEDVKLANAKVEAIRKLRPYLSDENEDKVEAAQNGIDAIEAATSIEDEDGNKGVKTLLSETLVAIGAKDTTEETRKNAIKAIEEYRKTASELGFNTLAKNLSNYKDAVNEAGTEAEINKTLDAVEAYIATEPSFNAKITAIANIKTTYLDGDANKPYVKVKEYTTMVNKAIEDIKDAEKVEDIENDGSTGIVDKFTVAIATLKTDIDSYLAAQTAAVTAIKGYDGDADNGSSLEQSYIDDVNNVTYKDYVDYEEDKTSDDDTTTVFTSITAAAEKLLKPVAEVPADPVGE